METNYVLEGNISVKAAILAGIREVYEIYVDHNKDDKDTNFILMQAKRRRIKINKVDREKINEMAEGSTHGGLIAICGERSFQTLDDIKEDEPFLALVEGIEDPFNFGYILRSLYASGCTGVIVGERNWSSAATTITKASAGASEYIALIPYADMEEAISDLHQRNIPLICANRKDAVSIMDYTFPKSLCIGIGGEMRGLSKTVQRASDENVYIPYANEFKNALNAAASTSIFAFEIQRQRQK